MDKKNTKFSEFIRNASEEEKRETYMRVMEQANASQLILMISLIKQKSVKLLAITVLQATGILICFFALIIHSVEVIPMELRLILANLVPVIWGLLIITLIVSWDLIQSIITTCKIFSSKSDQEKENNNEPV